jgi:hypothetical protein
MKETRFCYGMLSSKRIRGKLRDDMAIRVILGISYFRDAMEHAGFPRQRALNLISDMRL